MAVSQKQIAERLGVSIALVSRVLSGKAREVGIADATVERVMKVAEEMGYVPSAAALTLKGKASRTIGVVVYDFRDPFFGAIIEQLQAQAHEQDYSLVLAGFKGRHPESSDLAPLHKHAIDGLVVIGSADRSEWLAGFRQDAGGSHWPLRGGRGGQPAHWYRRRGCRAPVAGTSLGQGVPALRIHWFELVQPFLALPVVGKGCREFGHGR